MKRDSGADRGKQWGRQKDIRKKVAHSVTFQVADAQHEGKIPGGLLLYLLEGAIKRPYEWVEESVASLLNKKLKSASLLNKNRATEVQIEVGTKTEQNHS